MGHDDFGSRKGRRSFMPIKARKTYSGRVGLVIRCLSIGSRALLHAFFRPHLAMTPLRFANPSPPSGWVEDFHLQAVVHTRHTRKKAGVTPAFSIHVTALRRPRRYSAGGSANGSASGAVGTIAVCFS